MKRSKLGVIVAVSALVLLGTLVGRTVFSGPAFVARAEDRADAQRNAGEPGALDPRDAIPEGSFVAGNGRVEPKGREVRVSANAAGRVAVVHVEEGQKVEAGSVIVELETSAEAAAMNTARAELDRAKAELARVLEGPRVEDVQALQAEARAAEARADLARGEAKRARALADDGAISTEALERAKREADALEALASAARSKADAAKAGSRRQDVAAARSRVRAAEARVQEMGAHLERLRVHAPFDAEILQVKFRVSEYFDPRNGEPLVVLGDTSKLHVRMDVDERDVGKVRLGAAAFATAEAFPGKRFEGKVIEIGRQMGRKNIRTDEPTERLDTKILEVLVEVDDPEGLVPGMRVTSYVEL